MYLYLLCLCILILCLGNFIVLYVLYSVSLCCFVYCLCVNVYLQLPPVLKPIELIKYINKCIIYVCNHFPPFALADPFYDGRLSHYNKCGTKLEKETWKFHRI